MRPMSEYDELLKPRVVYNPKNVVAEPLGSGEISVKIKQAPVKPINDQEINQLKFKKAWELAISPAKSIPMNLIMSYMSGNSLQIIPMTMTLMLLWNPLKAIFNDTNSIFKDLQTKQNGSQINMLKLVYILCQLLNMAIGIYKLYVMGLIPHADADWLAWRQPLNLKEKLSVLNIQ